MTSDVTGGPSKFVDENNIIANVIYDVLETPIAPNQSENVELNVLTPGSDTQRTPLVVVVADQVDQDVTSPECLNVSHTSHIVEPSSPQVMSATEPPMRVDEPDREEPILEDEVEVEAVGEDFEPDDSLLASKVGVFVAAKLTKKMNKKAKKDSTTLPRQARNLGRCQVRKRKRRRLLCLKMTTLRKEV